MWLSRKVNIVNAFKYQYLLLLLALSFFTRIPVNLSTEIKPNMLHDASRYFAFIGTIIGILLATTYYLFSLFLPEEIAVLLTIAINIVLTGAFHEDGWADVWDGFGGGWSVEQKLTIMKDSRLGTYGAAALILALSLKYQSLLALSGSIELIIYSLVLANTASRTLATSLIFSLTYVSEDATSKVKPVAKQLSITSLSVLMITSLCILILGCSVNILSFVQIVYLFIVLLITRISLKYWFTKQLGGFTGDCLGAAQIASELIIYFTLIIFYTHSGNI